jgi:hypothetical protein
MCAATAAATLLPGTTPPSTELTAESVGQDVDEMRMSSTEAPRAVTAGSSPACPPAAAGARVTLNEPCTRARTTASTSAPAHASPIEGAERSYASVWTSTTRARTVTRSDARPVDAEADTVTPRSASVTTARAPSTSSAPSMCRTLMPIAAPSASTAACSGQGCARMPIDSARAIAAGVADSSTGAAARAAPSESNTATRGKKNIEIL